MALANGNGPQKGTKGLKTYSRVSGRSFCAFCVPVMCLLWFVPFVGQNR